MKYKESKYCMPAFVDGKTCEDCKHDLKYHISFESQTIAMKEDDFSIDTTMEINRIKSDMLKIPRDCKMYKSMEDNIKLLEQYDFMIGNPIDGFKFCSYEMYCTKEIDGKMYRVRDMRCIVCERTERKKKQGKDVE